MHSNLQLIYPLQENELFSIHKQKKLIFSNYSFNSFYNTIYRPFNTQKQSLTALHKTKKFGVTLTNMNPKSRTNYNLKQNLLSHVPYPSFPNNNRIPAIFKNSHKTPKYPKIMNNNFTIYNFNKQKQKDITLKDKLFTNNSNTMNNTYDKMHKENIKQNRTYGGGTKFLKFNDLCNKTHKIIKKKKFEKKGFNLKINKKKKVEIKPKIKINNFDDILGNIMHLIEMRDENNNIIYTKVTNLLIDEINKLIELQKRREQLQKYKNQGTSTYRKIKIKKRKLHLGNEDKDESFIKKKNKRHGTVNIKSIDLNFQQKFGFELNLDDSSLGNRAKSDLSSLSDDSSYGNNIYKDLHSKNKKYKNEYGQTNESIFQNNKYNSFKGNFNNNENINDKKENNNGSNDNKNSGFNIGDGNKKSSLFNNFLADNIKKNEKKQKVKQYKVNNKQTQDKLDFSNLLSNIVSKIEPNSNIKKNEENKKTNNNKSDVPFFEQMVNNERLVKLIHEYLKYKDENEEEESENEEKIEEIKNEDKIEYNIENTKTNNQIKEANGNEINKGSDNNEEYDKNEEKRKMITDLYKQNLVTNDKKVDRRKKRSRTYIVKKLELGMEIIKHICGEVNISNNEKDNISNCLFNLMRISRKVNRTEKEDELQKKLLKPINEITQKYLENMFKINNSNEKPNSLLSMPLKAFLKAKLNEILNIANEDNNEEEEKKKKAAKRKKIRESQKKQKKKLIYEHSYFFRKDPKVKRRKSIDFRLTQSINNNSTEEPNNLNMSTTSFDKTNNKKLVFKRRNSKFIKTKRKMEGLIKLKDEKAEKIENNIKKEEKVILTNEDILDKRLKAFFEQIKMLKNIKNSKDEEKLRMFIDKEMEKFDYTQEKKIEARKYNFFNDLKVTRYVSKNGKYSHNNKLLFHSPIVFNTYKDNE